MHASLCTLMLAISLLVQNVVAGPRHGHFHKKRALDVITDWDITYDTVTDVVWVTVTDEHGNVATTTTPAAAVAATTTTAPVIPTPTVVDAPATTAAAVDAAAAVVQSTSTPISVAAPTTLSTLISSAPAAAATTAAAAAAATTSSGKRGLSYNVASNLDSFAGSELISWAYNWASFVNGTIPSGMQFVPMLWGLEESATSVWEANAQAALNAGSTALLCFNEPDNPQQSNIEPADAATGYINYMNQFSGKATLVSPAITNGGGSEGITWLENFITACDNKCLIDAVAIHWYDSATNYAYFKDHIEQAYVAGGNRTLWLTEFGATGTDEEIVNFLQIVMPWLDQTEYVGHYAYFMDEVGVLLEAVDEISSVGSTFADFTSETVNSLIADAS